MLPTGVPVTGFFHQDDFGETVNDQIWLRLRKGTG